MTRSEFAKGSLTFLAIIVAGFSSAVWVDRHYGEVERTQIPSASTSACVTEDGSWKNWIWANVPMLSPKCPAKR